jgi:hypothetical protein
MSCADNDLNPPCLEALVAGTFALMTCWASPAADARLPSHRQRTLMARKIVSNLFFLKNHPHASPGLRQVMARAHERWVLLTESAGDASVVTRASDPLATLPGGGLLH